MTEASQAEKLAAKIIDRADAGYRNQEKSGYPPYALTAWDDRVRWTGYLRKVMVEVLTEELKR